MGRARLLSKEHKGLRFMKIKALSSIFWFWHEGKFIKI